MAAMEIEIGHLFNYFILNCNCTYGIVSLLAIDLGILVGDTKF